MQRSAQSRGILIDRCLTPISSTLPQKLERSSKDIVSEVRPTHTRCARISPRKVNILRVRAIFRCLKFTESQTEGTKVRLRRKKNTQHLLLHSYRKIITVNYRQDDHFLVNSIIMLLITSLHACHYILISYHYHFRVRTKRTFGARFRPYSFPVTLGIVSIIKLNHSSQIISPIDVWVVWN